MCPCCEKWVSGGRPVWVKHQSFGVKEALHHSQQMFLVSLQVTISHPWRDIPVSSVWWTEQKQQTPGYFKLAAEVFHSVMSADGWLHMCLGWTFYIERALVMLPHIIYCSIDQYIHTRSGTRPTYLLIKLWCHRIRSDWNSYSCFGNSPVC